MYIHRPHLRIVKSTNIEAQYSNWRYKQIGRTDATDYSSPTYDDSAWAVGTAPFGAWFNDTSFEYSTPHAYDPRFAIAFATHWTTGTRLWIRRGVRLYGIPANGFNCVSFIEDNCKMYINGTLVLDTPDGPSGGSGFTTHLTADKFIQGNNIIAVQCNDESTGVSGGVTYADFLFDPIP